MLYVGIDPGLTGAVAIIDPDTKAGVVDMPDNPQELWKIIENASKYPCRCALEKVSAMPKQGVSSTFSFGVGYGMIQGMLWAAKIPFVFVTPRKWQAVVFDSAIRKRLPKDQSLDLARRLWPTLDLSKKKHHGRADALLIAQWLQRTYPTN